MLLVFCSIWKGILILNFLLLPLLSVLFLRRSLLVQHQGRVKEALDNLSSFQTSISAGRRALQVRINCIHWCYHHKAPSHILHVCENFFCMSFILFNKMKFSFRWFKRMKLEWKRKKCRDGCVGLKTINTVLSANKR